MAEKEKTTSTTTTTSSGNDPQPVPTPAVAKEEESNGTHDIVHVTPKKKKDKKKKNKDASSGAEAVTINQIEAAMAQFGLHTSSKPAKSEKNSHAFWDTQPVPKKGKFTYTNIVLACIARLYAHHSFLYLKTSLLMRMPIKLLIL